MANAAGESESSAVQLDFNRRLTLQFCGSVVTSEPNTDCRSKPTSATGK